MTKHARLDELARIMAASNITAKAVCEQLFGSDHYESFRAALRGEPSDLTRDQLQLVALIPDSDRNEMLAVEHVSDEIFGLLMPIVKQQCKRIGGIFDMEPSELFGEAWFAVRKGLYSFTQATTKVISYFSITIRNELKRYAMQNFRNALLSRNGEYLTLRRAMLDAETILSHQLDRLPNIEEMHMHIRAKFPDIKKLFYKLRCLQLTVDFGDDLLTEDDKSNDYTALAHRNSRFSPDDGLFDESAEELMDRANLPQEVKKIMKLRLQDAGIDDIAEQLGLTASIVKSKIKTARRKLREYCSLKVA